MDDKHVSGDGDDNHSNDGGDVTSKNGDDINNQTTEGKIKRELHNTNADIVRFAKRHRRTTLSAAFIMATSTNKLDGMFIFCTVTI
jgi:cyclophilin family peptidyl-prolyl cis-trans isomerase